MPDDADAPIARLAARPPARFVAAARFAQPDAPPPQPRRAQRFGDRGLHGVELVVAGHLLGERAAAVVLEHDEAADQRQEAARLEHAFDQHLQLRQEHRRQPFAVDGPPRLEPLPSRRERAEPGLDAVRYGQDGVEGEQRRQLRPIGPELPPGGVDGGVLVGGVLQLDDAQRQAVDEHHHVGPAFALVLDHGELVDHEPVVGVGLVEVEHPHLRAADRAAVVAVLHRDAVHHHAVKGAVARFQGRSFGTGQPAHGVVACLGGQAGVQPRHRVPQDGFQNDVPVAGPQRARPRRHVRPADDAVAQLPEPVERSFLDDGLGHHGHRDILRAPAASSAASMTFEALEAGCVFFMSITPAILFAPSSRPAGCAADRTRPTPQVSNRSGTPARAPR